MKNSIYLISVCVYCILLMLSCTVLLLDGTDKVPPQPQILTEKSVLRNAEQVDQDKMIKRAVLREQSTNLHDTKDSQGVTAEMSESKENGKKEETTAEIHSSFEEAVSSQGHDAHTPNQVNNENDVKQADITEGLSETSQAVVFTLVDSAAAEQQRVGSADVPGEPLKADNLSAGTTAAAPVTVAIESAASPDSTPPPQPVDSVNVTEPAEPQQYVVRAEPKVVEQRAAAPPAAAEDGSPVANDSADQPAVAAADAPTSAKADADHSPPEDIPSFSEWRLKHLAEDEQKKKEQNNTASAPVSQSRPGGTSKLRSKNYASPDCGAKVVAANPEATSASSVLSPSRDEYLLNTCTSRIWFVAELCEAIQAKKIDIANFELFSSSPRDFSVYVSDRFPTRDWQNVGNFIAEDERTIQSFNLHPHLFGKFIKVEFHSHYGSEHFCPVSLFRAYGTSEFEVLETVDQVLETDQNIDDDDEDDDEPLDGGKGEPSTIFDNARYAILSIVTKAAEALGKSGDSQNNTQTLNKTTVCASPQISNIEPCRSPRHIVVCDNCSDSLFGDVFKLLSCEGSRLQALIDSSFILDTMRDSKLCSPYGLDFTSRKLGAPYPLRPGEMFSMRHIDPGGYITALFPPKYIAALCNMLAVIEKRVALNVSEALHASPVLESEEREEGESQFVEDNLEHVLKPISTCTLTTSLNTQLCNISSAEENTDSILLPMATVHIDSSIAAQIRPTKTLERVDDEELAASLLTASKVMPGTETVITEQPASPETLLQVSTVPHVIEENANGSSQTKAIEPKEQLEDSSTLQAGDVGLVLEESVTMPVTAEEPVQDNMSLDSLLNELKDLERVVDSSTAPAVATTMAPPSVPTQQVQKESVFVRLANKIKALERNMSLSGQYLEELSRRYKKQVEEMQRSFNRTLAIVLDQNRKAEERERRRMEETLELKQQILVLSTTVETIVSERTSWAATGYALMQPLFFIVVFAVMLQYLRHHATMANVHVNEDNRQKLSIGWRSKKANRFAEKRRRSVEGVSGHEIRKLKKRRPSEETLVTGSYYELLIPDNQTTEMDGGVRTVLKLENKRRRRKKKDSLPKSDSSSEAQKPVGSSDETQLLQKSPQVNNSVAVNGLQVADNRETIFGAEQIPNEFPCRMLELVQHSSAESLPKTIGNTVQHSGSTDSSLPNRCGALLQLEVLYSNKQATDKVNLSESVPILGQNNGSVKHQGLSPKIRHLSAPLFMKTAIATRSGRRSTERSPTPQAKLKSDNWEWYSSRKSSGSSHTVTAPGMVQNGDRSSQVSSDSIERTSDVDSAVDTMRKETSKKQTSSLKKIGSWRLHSLFKN